MPSSQETNYNLIAEKSGVIRLGLNFQKMLFFNFLRKNK